MLCSHQRIKLTISNRTIPFSSNTKAGGSRGIETRPHFFLSWWWDVWRWRSDTCWAPQVQHFTSTDSHSTLRSCNCVSEEQFETVFLTDRSCFTCVFTGDSRSTLHVNPNLSDWTQLYFSTESDTTEIRIKGACLCFYMFLPLNYWTTELMDNFSKVLADFSLCSTLIKEVTKHHNLTIDHVVQK